MALRETFAIASAIGGNLNVPEGIRISRKLIHCFNTETHDKPYYIQISIIMTIVSVDGISA